MVDRRFVAGEHLVGAGQPDQQRRVATLHPEIDPRMADARTLPVDDAGQLIVDPHGVAVPEVAVDEDRLVVRHRDAPQDALGFVEQRPRRFGPAGGVEVDGFDRASPEWKVK